MLTERFEQALLFAARAHAKQTRKGCDIPYFAHLMSVAALVLEHGGGEAEAIAALLHDAVEDQGGEAMMGRIEKAFGPKVGALVRGCSEQVASPKPPWLHRKLDYIDRIAHAEPSVRLIVLADKVHNTRDLLADYRRRGVVTFERFTGGARGAIWFYRATADALSKAQPPVAGPLVEELERCVSELERVTGIRGRDVGRENL
jgi:(p)ppGpp synthase/HD superfamily hydrolase